MFEAGFVGFDDAAYVTGNDAVQRGLNWQTVAWASRATLAGNWFPLTWLSHLVDCQFYGLKPAGTTWPTCCCTLPPRCSCSA